MKQRPRIYYSASQRALIWERWRKGETIHQIAGLFDRGHSSIQRILAESGFVTMRPDGQRRLYALKPEPFRELDAWLGPYRELWEARLDRFGAALEKRRTSPRDTEERSKRR